MLHIAAATQVRLDTPGRAYYRRKLAEGKTQLEAMRCLKRRISDAVYRRLLADAHVTALAAEREAGQLPINDAGTGPGGHCGATQESSAVDLPPHIDTSDQPLPGPATTTLQPATPTRKNYQDNEPLRPPVDNRGKPDRRQLDVVAWQTGRARRPLLLLRRVDESRTGRTDLRPSHRGTVSR